MTTQMTVGGREAGFAVLGGVVVLILQKFAGWGQKDQQKNPVTNQAVSPLEDPSMKMHPLQAAITPTVEVERSPENPIIFVQQRLPPPKKQSQFMADTVDQRDLPLAKRVPANKTVRLV